MGKDNKSSIWITGNKSKEHVHNLRSKVDAIMVGRNTAQIDAPQLTVRKVAGNNPKRIILDTNRVLPLTLNIFNDKDAETFIMCSDKRFVDNKTSFCKFLSVKEKELMLDPYDILRKIAREGVTSVLIEGGPKVHQSFMELETRYHAYKSIVRNLREAEVRVKIIERDIKKEPDQLEKELMVIKLEDLMYDITVFKRKMSQCERELRTYLELLEKTKEKKLEEYLEEDDTEERKYWMARMQKQAAMDIIAYGRVGSGNMDSILLMPEEDQLETLRGALHFSGLLTNTIGQINKQVEGQINSEKALEGLQMPLLTDSKKLFEIKLDEENIQHTDQSKIDGTTI